MQKISPYELAVNPFEAIHHKWAMITTQSGEKVNTMVASWGGVGIMWNRPVTWVFLRPQRFTRDLLDRSERFSVCFLPEQYRQQMNYCGSHSGRAEEKLAVCGFEAVALDGAPVLAQSELALTCRKLYRQPMDPACFLDHEPDTRWYPEKDYHIMYVSEILGAYQGEL